MYAASTTRAADDRFLKALTDQTGGRRLSVESTKGVDAAFLEMLNEFRRRYVVSYTPTGVAARGLAPPDGAREEPERDGPGQARLPGAVLTRNRSCEISPGVVSDRCPSPLRDEFHSGRGFGPTGRGFGPNPLRERFRSLTVTQAMPSGDPDVAIFPMTWNVFRSTTARKFSAVDAT